MSILQVLLVTGTHGNEINGPWLFEQWMKNPKLINDFDLKNIKEVEKKSVKVKGRNLQNLLYNWLEEIVTITITDGFAINNFFVNIKKNDEYEIISTISGEKLDLEKHNFKVEIKSPTFHLMEIKENGKITMRYLLDL